jgi:O-antigen biosynthesis protein WbqP
MKSCRLYNSYRVVLLSIVSTGVRYDVMIYLSLKRGLDLLSALALGLVLLPFFILIAILIKLDSPGPIFFRQTRIGRHSKPFTIYKFRSMKVNAPMYIPTAELENPEEHLTRLGHFLRKSSIDELPQLLNILTGDMSVIGPRPVIPVETELIATRQANGADRVYPGITGLAQVIGRDELDHIEKARYDEQYANQVSLFLDTKILFQTLWMIISRKHIAH